MESRKLLIWDGTRGLLAPASVPAARLCLPRRQGIRAAKWGRIQGSFGSPPLGPMPWFVDRLHVLKPNIDHNERRVTLFDLKPKLL